MHQITITDFILIKRAQIELEEKKIHLFAGANEVGKTSIKKAVSCLLTRRFMPEGEPQTKSSKVVRTGSPMAMATLRPNGTKDDAEVYSIKWANQPSGSVQLIGKQFFNQSDFSIGKDFARMEMKDRAALLIPLLQAVPTEKDFIDECAAQHIPPTYAIAAWGKIENQTWAAANESLKNDGIALKRRFNDLTGSNWGKDQGARFLPPNHEMVPTFTKDEEVHKQYRLDVEYADKEVEKALVNLGASQEKVRRLEELNQKNHTTIIIEAQATLNACNEDIQIVEKDIQALKTMSAHTIDKCPHCEQEIVCHDNQHTKKAEGQVNAGPDTARQIMGLNQRLSAMKNKATDCAVMIKQHQDHLKEIAELENEIGGKRADSSADQVLKSARENLERANKILNAYDLFQDVTECDMEIKISEKLRYLTDSSGLQQTVLANKLADFNKKINAMSPWDHVAILPDMSVVYSGYAYNSLSKARSWIVDLLLRVAICELQNDEIILVDDADDIVGQNKNRLFNFLYSTKHTYLVFMAESKAENISDATKKLCKTYWVEDGQCNELKAALATA